MRITVVGAGAIGGVIAARLAAVADVSVLARGATLAALADGLLVETADGNVTRTRATVLTAGPGWTSWRGTLASRALTASDSAATLGVQDVVIVAVKAQSMPSVAASIGPLLGPDTGVLSTLNGVPWWFLDGFGGPAAGRHLDSVDPGGQIASVLPAARVIGGTVHLSASSPAPGEVSWRSGNGLIIGELDGSSSPRLGALATALRAAGFDVTTSPRIRDDVWYKLWGNLTLNPICALTGASTGPALDDDLVRDFISRAMLEARGTRKLGDFVPSMLQDARARRPLELDALTGAVRELGALTGVPTPYVDALHGLTRLWMSAR
jgi:2-dehydropantoate 2-reductase